MSKIGLVIQREYTQRVKKRTFILTTLLTPLLLIGLMVVPVLISIYGGGEKRTIAIVDRSGVVGQEIANTDEIEFTISNSDYPQAAEENGDVFGFLVIEPDAVTNPAGVTLYTRDNSTLEVEKSVNRQVSKSIKKIRIAQSNVAGIDSMLTYFDVDVPMKTYSMAKEGESMKESSSTLSMIIAYIAGFIIYMFIFMYGAMVMQGVVEEKANRIIEVIVSSVKPFELMMGKIIGVAMVALTQVMIWVVLIGVGMAIIGGIASSGGAADIANMGANMGAMPQNMPSDVSGGLGAIGDLGYIASVVGAFILFFIGGYLLYASMFAAIGSGVDNVGDTQQLQMPVTIPLILALFVMMSVMREPNSSLAFWFSIIPFTSPIVMMARVAYGVPLWEFCLSIAILYSTFIVITMFAAKIYRVGIFMYGKKPTLKELIKWSKFKS